MRLFEDILDDLTAIDSKAKQSAVSDPDKLYEPMDVEQFEVLLRFNVFYDIYLTKAQQVRRIKERVGDVLEATSGISSYSRVLCVTDTTAPLYIKLTDEIEEDPYGEIKTLHWNSKKGRWEGNTYCRDIAVFGEWDYQPYLN